MADTNNELTLIQKALDRVGIKSLLNHGAGSIVWSEGVEGVTQDDLLAYTREIVLHCAVALGASPSDAALADGWMPIETAPRDGTKFLAYRPLAALTHDPEIRVVRGIAHDHGCWEKTVPAGCSKENFTDGACKPTHWRPLPAPPAINASGEVRNG